MCRYSQEHVEYRAIRHFKPNKQYTAFPNTFQSKCVFKKKKKTKAIKVSQQNEMIWSLCKKKI